MTGKNIKIMAALSVLLFVHGTVTPVCIPIKFTIENFFDHLTIEAVNRFFISSLGFTTSLAGIITLYYGIKNYAKTDKSPPKYNGKLQCFAGLILISTGTATVLRYKIVTIIKILLQKLRLDKQSILNSAS